MLAVRYDEFPAHCCESLLHNSSRWIGFHSSFRVSQLQRSRHASLRATMFCRIIVFFQYWARIRWECWGGIALLEKMHEHIYALFYCNLNYETLFLILSLAFDYHISKRFALITKTQIIWVCFHRPPCAARIHPSICSEVLLKTVICVSLNRHISITRRTYQGRCCS